ncbi:hypothetical protein BGX34_006621, partial [Mortierella sp. NVP85]
MTSVRSGGSKKLRTELTVPDLKAPWTGLTEAMIKLRRDSRDFDEGLLNPTNADGLPYGKMGLWKQVVNQMKRYHDNPKHKLALKDA